MREAGCHKLRDGRRASLSSGRRTRVVGPAGRSLRAERHGVAAARECERMPMRAPGRSPTRPARVGDHDPQAPSDELLRAHWLITVKPRCTWRRNSSHAACARGAAGEQDEQTYAARARQQQLTRHGCGCDRTQRPAASSQSGATPEMARRPAPVWANSPRRAERPQRNATCSRSAACPRVVATSAERRWRSRAGTPHRGRDQRGSYAAPSERVARWTCTASGAAIAMTDDVCAHNRRMSCGASARCSVRSP